MSIAEVHPQGLSIQLAGAEDFEAIKAMMGRSNTHSIERSGGTVQWGMIDYVHGQIEHHINAGELFVARGTGNRIIGCVALTEQDSMWPDQATSNALYFHKLMKDPEAGDESIGMAKRLLGFTADEALRRGKDTVRCDVKTELPRLVQYYVDGFGFEPRGTAVYGSTQLEATLLETYPMTLKARCDGPDAQTEPVSIGT